MTVVGPPSVDGFSVLDGVALVAGAAVASIHVRLALHHEPVGGGWAIILGTFAWVAVTAAGPFLLLSRRFARGGRDRARTGEWLWAMLGTPWLLTALIQTRGMATGAEGAGGWFSAVLGLGLGLASLAALAVVWMTWVMVSPERASMNFEGPWSNRVGLILAVAWPIQCGLGMVVTG